MGRRSCGPTGWKRRVFQAVCVVMGLFAFVVVEGLIRWTGVAEGVDPGIEPWLEFHDRRPLFQPNERGDRMEITPEKLRYFAPESFWRSKPDKARRIFCLGGSTVQGRPYSKKTSFSAWLELSLNAADTDRTWEVVNCGGVSYASYRLVPLLEECLQYRPDLIILCTGQNEFLEDRSYGKIRKMPRWVGRAVRQISRLHTYLLMRLAIRKWFPGYDDLEIGRRLVTSPPPREVETRLDYRGGTKAYHRDDRWRAAVGAHFEANLRVMVAMCRAADVPIILVRPPVNLRDCPPFKSEHTGGLSSEERKRWSELSAQARREYAHDLDAAIAKLREAVRWDPRHAATQFALAKCLDAKGDFAAARRHYLRALDEDICPLRLPTQLG